MQPFFINMNKQNILKLLESISYPGFNRDIVSFGMVKDIKIDDHIVNISLSISSQNQEKKQLVVEDIKKILSKQVILIVLMDLLKMK